MCLHLSMYEHAALCLTIRVMFDLRAHDGHWQQMHHVICYAGCSSSSSKSPVLQGEAAAATAASLQQESPHVCGSSSRLFVQHSFVSVVAVLNFLPSQFCILGMARHWQQVLESLYTLTL
jgi:hypothetical protein